MLHKHGLKDISADCFEQLKLNIELFGSAQKERSETPRYAATLFAFVN